MNIEKTLQNKKKSSSSKVFKIRGNKNSLRAFRAAKRSAKSKILKQECKNDE